MEQELKNKVVAGTVAPKDLPAGAPRDEALSIAKDALEVKAEVQGENTGSINPEALEEDREILQHYSFSSNLFEVSNPQEGFRYLWCPDKPDKINEAKMRARSYLGSPHTGFVIVGGDDPECREYRDERGFRVLGDCLLMRIPEKTYNRIMQAQARYNDIRNSPDAVQLMATAERFRQQVGDKVAAHVIVGQDPRAYFAGRAQNRGREIRVVSNS